VPFLQPVFGTTPLCPTEWAVVLSLSLIPAIVEELAKFFVRRSGNHLY
jgi:hypothetical protein